MAHRICLGRWNRLRSRVTCVANRFHASGGIESFTSVISKASVASILPFQYRVFVRPIYRHFFSTNVSSDSDSDPDSPTDNESKTMLLDVVILGGGPVGLFLSNLLTSYQIHSHILFDKRSENELLSHPQAHFINVRSMEILKAEIPLVFHGILREEPSIEEWDGFCFGGSVLDRDLIKSGDDDNVVVGGKRLGRVIHPVREPLREGQSGDALLVPKYSQNGSSSPKTKHSKKDVTGSLSQMDEDYVSMCRPAHLAQNKFVHLLLREAQRRFDSSNSCRSIDSCLRYNEEVVNIKEINPSDECSRKKPVIEIQTSGGSTYYTRYLLAADGVHSFARKQFQIPMLGDSSLQSLVNVHFRTNGNLAKLLMKRSSSSSNCNSYHNHDQAMLHFVYNSQLVGAFVCHDGHKGEWVLQIPFFPPFQTMDEFTEERVRDMIWSGLGVFPKKSFHLKNSNESSANSGNKNYDFDIISIRPWTMSSLVAQTYLNKSKSVALVGDACHAFPPAGGFGMNTGLQDAHNIAWRLAMLLHRENELEKEQQCSHPNSINFDVNRPQNLQSKSEFPISIISKYESDRKPIAQQNAALSVRNYKRTLRIARACYLNARHPQMLISVLNSSPMKFMPLEAKRGMFSRLVKVAMSPLKSLTIALKNEKGGVPGSMFYANHVERNVRSILERGRSLPLVFPRYELDFSYDGGGKVERELLKESDDTAGYYPHVRVGHRLPHVLVEVLESSNRRSGLAIEKAERPSFYSSLVRKDPSPAFVDSNKCFEKTDPANRSIISLVDISSQIRHICSYHSPLFTILCVGSTLSSNSVKIEESVDNVMKKWHVPMVLVYVLSKKPDHFLRSKLMAEKCEVQVEFFLDHKQKLLELSLKQQSPSNNLTEPDARDKENAEHSTACSIVVVRPDGHISNISLVGEYDAKWKEESFKQCRIQDIIEQGLMNAL